MIRRTTRLTAAIAISVATCVFAVAQPSSATNEIERRIIGASVQGRAIGAIRLGTPGGLVVVIVGVIHGDEAAGLLITDELASMSVPQGIDLWLVPTMNPDGTALNRRGNANRVDLNRNFPYLWAKMGKKGYWQYAGPSRASEPETKAVVAFMKEIKPALGIWYHQDLNIISPGTGIEGKLRAKYSQLTGIPLKRIAGGTYTGVAATWQRNTMQDGYAFVVELAETLSTEQAKVHASAVLDVAMLLRGK